MSWHTSGVYNPWPSGHTCQLSLYPSPGGYRRTLMRVLPEKFLASKLHQLGRTWLLMNTMRVKRTEPDLRHPTTSKLKKEFYQEPTPPGTTSSRHCLIAALIHFTHLLYHSHHSACACPYVTVTYDLRGEGGRGLLPVYTHTAANTNQSCVPHTRLRGLSLLGEPRFFFGWLCTPPSEGPRARFPGGKSPGATHPFPIHHLEGLLPLNSKLTRGPKMGRCYLNTIF